MKIAVVAHLDAPAIDLLRRHLAGHDVVWAHRQGQDQPWREGFSACEVVFGNIPASWFRDLTSLRWLQLESIGFESYLDIAADINRRGIQVTNLRGQFAQPAAETALAGTLALYRGIDQLGKSQSERRWASLEVRPTMEVLHGKEVVILGAGSIGLQLRKLLVAFDCRVRSFARTSSLAELHTLEELDDALPSADIVANCLPGTPDTRLLVDPRRLSLLAATAIFVNVGRGNVMDEAGLASAITDGSSVGQYSM